MKNLLYLFFAVTIFSCSSDSDESSEDFNSNSALIGDWVTIYEGDDYGYAEVTVSSSGVISGTLENIEGTFPVTGNVSNNGNLNATSGNVGNGYVTTFSGNLQTNGTGSGTWSSTYLNFTGSWTATQQ
jgi:hypothetical protein